MGKKKIFRKNYLFIFLVVLTSFIFCSCIKQSDPNNPPIAKKTAVNTNVEIIRNLLPKLESVEKCYWRQETLGQNSRISVPGPSTYRYVGVVFISKSEAEKINNKYKWFDAKCNDEIIEYSQLKNYKFNWKRSEALINDYYFTGTDEVDIMYFDKANSAIFFKLMT
jgi:hypothetical protein